MGIAQQIFKNTKSKNALKDVFHAVIDDSSINTIITYRQHKGAGIGNYNPENQVVPSTLWKVFSNLNALKTYFTEFEIFTAGGQVEFGDVRFIIWKDDVTNSPGPEDLIVETKNQSGVTYAITEGGIQIDPLDIAYIFHCRRP